MGCLYVQQATQWHIEVLTVLEDKSIDSKSGECVTLVTGSSNCQIFVMLICVPLICRQCAKLSCK